ncbi:MULTISPECIES: hypothetical protein [unclassified Enterococcus]|uniref:hypothetical protein n=1 Tax=unclassified Enterococcus TaxID=2608891 RepID=UPI003F2788AD
MAGKIDGTLKKRVQSLMALNSQSYEEWINSQHQNYLNEQAEVIDQLLKKELERKKQEKNNCKDTQNLLGGNPHEK